MPSIVPFTGRPQESMSITIAGRRLRLRARYANLTNIWTLDVFDNAGDGPVPIVQGVNIVMGADLLAPYLLGIGGLYAEPTADPMTDAGRGELGNRIRLIHYTQAELDALEAA